MWGERSPVACRNLGKSDARPVLFGFPHSPSHNTPIRRAGLGTACSTLRLYSRDRTVIAKAVQGENNAVPPEPVLFSRESGENHA